MRNGGQQAVRWRIDRGCKIITKSRIIYKGPSLPNAGSQGKLVGKRAPIPSPASPFTNPSFWRLISEIHWNANLETKTWRGSPSTKAHIHLKSRKDHKVTHRHRICFKWQNCRKTQCEPMLRTRVHEWSEVKSWWKVKVSSENVWKPRVIGRNNQRGFRVRKVKYRWTCLTYCKIDKRYEENERESDKLGYFNWWN